MGRAGTWVLWAVAAAVALVGCGGSSTTTVKDTSTTLSIRSVATPAPKIPCSSKPMLASAPTGTCRGAGRVYRYAVYGNPLELDTLSFRVSSVKIAVNFKFPQGGGYSATAGDKFVRVVVALTNRVNLPAEIDRYASEVGLITNAGFIPAEPQSTDPLDFTNASKLLEAGATFNGALAFNLTHKQAAALESLGGFLEVGNFGQEVQGSDYKRPRGLVFIKAT